MTIKFYSKTNFVNNTNNYVMTDSSKSNRFMSCSIKNNNLAPAAFENPKKGAAKRLCLNGHFSTKKICGLNKVNYKANF